MDFGKIIERTSVRTLLLILLLIIFAFSTIYYCLVNYFPNHSIVPTVKGLKTEFSDCLYFSVVTISSLGYGDYRPVGFSRLLAMSEVLLGLVFIALLVARISSERIATLTNLLYTSDANRTLKDFAVGIQERTLDLQQAELEGNDDKRLHVARGLKIHLANLKNFYGYHTGIGEFGDNWARKNSIRITNTLCNLIHELKSATYSCDTRKITIMQLEGVLSDCDSLVKFICNTHPSTSTDRIKVKCSQLLFHHQNKKKKGYKRPLVIRDWIIGVIIERLPKSPWPNNIHRNIAANIGLSNSTVQKVLYEIIERSKK